MFPVPGQWEPRAVPKFHAVTSSDLLIHLAPANLHSHRRWNREVANQYCTGAHNYFYLRPPASKRRSHHNKLPFLQLWLAGSSGQPGSIIAPSEDRHCETDQRERWPAILTVADLRAFQFV